ncbi:hypothetical protein [Loigolactobacillus binensis]|uniref:Uncharacterized protein n=1 Tax=Loigolactobacillus binensis TaxID=2559922 RepID=A0ABW3EBZ6_9LACO|nr:hypothetical protein [Loigolactobacillus binensis]
MITIDLIQEITRNDGTTYLDISNMMMNGRAELAAIRKMIKQVRIIQLNIPRSTAVVAYEQYLNQHFTMPAENFTTWEEWLPEVGTQSEAEYRTIIRENHVG